MAHPIPTLDLGSLNDRPTVRIDGKTYEMRTRDEFAYLTYRSQQRSFDRLGALMRKRRVTKAEEQEQARLLDAFVRQLVIAPEAIHDRMRDSHRLEIVKFFSSLLPMTTPASAPAVRRMNGHRR